MLYIKNGTEGHLIADELLKENVPPLCAGMAKKAGMTQEDALAAITICHVLIFSCRKELT